MKRARCPTCGAQVGTVFEHVDVECREIDAAPRDGSWIMGLFALDERWPIRWAEERSHPAGGHGLGSGWIDENYLPADPPEAWAPVAEGDLTRG